MDDQKVKVVMLLVIGFSLFFALWGIAMHAKVAQEEADFHALQAEYFNVDKTTRDSAETGSELNQALVEIQNYPSELMRLKLIGVGKILVGIYILLFGILIALIIMPMRLGKIMKKSKRR